MTVGEKIKATRKAKKMTQKELGDKCGINEANLRKYESGRQSPKIETLHRIAEGLGVPIETLIPVGLENHQNVSNAVHKNLDSQTEMLRKKQKLQSVPVNMDPEARKEYIIAYRENLINHFMFLQACSEGARFGTVVDDTPRRDRLQLMTDFGELLNKDGLDRIISYLIDLTKIPEYLE